MAGQVGLKARVYSKDQGCATAFPRFQANGGQLEAFFTERSHGTRFPLGPCGAVARGGKAVVTYPASTLMSSTAMSLDQPLPEGGRLANVLFYRLLSSGMSLGVLFVFVPFKKQLSNAPLTCFSMQLQGHGIHWQDSFSR